MIGSFWGLSMCLLNAAKFLNVQIRVFDCQHFLVEFCILFIFKFYVKIE